ncbi:hypothetical protein A6R68_07899 [Neotoma lepida]|uniref:Uncharacterized protein n=1 Tax=Neotoma lepida TaxID=56216 RepID=A0A1A6GB79_NEOLE|nr:hypothetical protein A6R68_07899 [Neotoma lepida]
MVRLCRVFVENPAIPGLHGAGFWRLPCAQDGQSIGPVFLHLSLHWQNGDNGFYFTHIQICNKMPNSVRSCPDKPPFVLVAFLNLEIAQLSHCLALPACYPSLLSAHYGRVLLGQQPLSGTLSPSIDNHCLPWNPKKNVVYGAELHTILGQPSPQGGCCEDVQLMQPLPRTRESIGALTAAPCWRHTGVSWVCHQFGSQGTASRDIFQGPRQ